MVVQRVLGLRPNDERQLLILGVCLLDRPLPLDLSWRNVLLKEIFKGEELVHFDGHEATAGDLVVSRGHAHLLFGLVSLSLFLYVLLFVDELLLPPRAHINGPWVVRFVPPGVGRVHQLLVSQIVLGVDRTDVIELKLRASHFILGFLL